MDGVCKVRASVSYPGRFSCPSGAKQEEATIWFFEESRNKFHFEPQFGIINSKLYIIFEDESRKKIEPQVCAGDSLSEQLSCGLILRSVWIFRILLWFIFLQIPLEAISILWCILMSCHQSSLFTLLNIFYHSYPLYKIF
jgi:hypothetical protein